MWLRIGISLVFIGLAVVHEFVPNVELDPETMILIALGVVPWLPGVLKSLELPGGFKIELPDVKNAADKVTVTASPRLQPGQVAERGSSAIDRELESLREIGQLDPTLALVGLRIEIEQRLREVAREHDLDAERRSARHLLRDLQRRGLLPSPIASGLQELILLGNRAAHGAPVSADAAQWALDAAPEVFFALDSYLGS